MDYGQTISQSWNLLWKHRFLWIFGFIAALGSSGGNFNPNRNFGGSTNPPGQNVLSPEVTQQIEQIVRALERGEYTEVMSVISVILGFSAIYLIALTGFLIIFAVALWLGSLIARAGLVAAVQADYQGEQIAWNQLVTTGTNKLLRLVGLKLILFGIPGLLFFFAFMASFAPIFLSMMQGFTAGQIEPPSALFATFPVLVCGFLCIGIPLSIAITIVDGYAFRGIVMDDMELFRGIKHGWQVGLDHVGPTIILGIIFTLAGLVTMAVVLFPIGIFTFIYDGIGVAGTVIAMLITWLITVVIGTLFVTMQSVAYSKAYLEFTGNKPALVDLE